MSESISPAMTDRPKIVTAVAEAARRNVKVVSERGLTLPTCKQLIQQFNQFAGRVTVSNGKTSVDGRSMVGLLRIAAVTGTLLTIELIGPNAEQMMQELGPQLANGF